jgi:hypothetical protein
MLHRDPEDNNELHSWGKVALRVIVYGCQRLN